MDVRSLVVPAPLQHPRNGRTDANLAKEVRAYIEAHPAVRFLADVLSALHAAPDPLRAAPAFAARFTPRNVMEAFEARPDLRARVLHALTGTPASLLRRMSPPDVAAQIELLLAEDLPVAERSVRSENDRTKSVAAIFLEYIEPSDLATYISAKEVWTYESHDAWWERQGEAPRRVLAAELRSLRKHKILSDTEILDLIGTEPLERDLPLTVRVELRNTARKTAAEGKAFTDTAYIDAVRTPDGAHDLLDDVVAAVPLAQLRKVIVHAAELMGLVAPPAAVRASVRPSTAASVRPTSGGNGTGAVKVPASSPTGFGSNGDHGTSTEAAPARKSEHPKSAAAATANSTADAQPLLELVEDEMFGQERTSGGTADEAFPNFDDTSSTDVHVAAKSSPSTPAKP